MLRNKQKKLISAERHIVGFNVIIFKKLWLLENSFF